MRPTEKTNHPIIHHLVLITKKYLATFADFTADIPLERYHYALLYIQQNNENLTQKDLAQHFNVDKSFMVSMIDYLTKHGFVYREIDINDRRKHLIKLTEKAALYLPKIDEAIEKTNRIALNMVSEDHKLLFWEVIKQIEINLNITREHNIIIDYTKSKI